MKTTSKTNKKKLLEIFFNKKNNWNVDHWLVF